MLFECSSCGRVIDSMVHIYSAGLPRCARCVEAPGGAIMCQSEHRAGEYRP